MSRSNGNEKEPAVLENPVSKIDPSNSNLDKTFLNKHSNHSPLLTLRRERGLSQRALASKLGIEKTRILRAERKPWPKITVEELEAYSKGLGIKIDELILRFNGFSKESFSRSSLKAPFFHVDPAPGVRFSSHLKKPDAVFAGTLRLAPHTTLAQTDVPRGEFVYYFIMEGNLLLTLASKQYFFKEGESFFVRENLPYELYNSHQFKELMALVFISPSFIRSSS